MHAFGSYLVIFAVIIYIILKLADSYRRRNRKWEDCPVCGSMVGMNRRKLDDVGRIWQGSCDNCYNHIEYDTNEIGWN